MQVGERPADSDHAARTELISEGSIAGIVQLVSRGGKNRNCGCLGRTRHSRLGQIRLIEHVRSLKQIVAQAKRHMRTQTVLKIDVEGSVCLVERTGVLINRESWTVGKNEMRPGSGFVERDRRRKRVNDIAPRIRAAGYVVRICGGKGQPCSQVIRPFCRSVGAWVRLPAHRRRRLHLLIAAGIRSGCFVAFHLSTERKGRRQQN